VLGVACVRQSADVVAVGGAGAGGVGGIARALLSPGRVEVGVGAIGVCELHRGLDRDAMAREQRQLVDKGVWLRPFGEVLYTMPLFNCKELNDEHVKKSERQCSRSHRSYSVFILQQIMTTY
jgi:hypothetical protein